MSALAVVLGGAAAFCFYLGSRQQRWRAHPLPAHFSIGGGAVLTVGALVVWGLGVSPATALFGSLVVLMAVFPALPVLALAWERRRGRARVPGAGAGMVAGIGARIGGAGIGAGIAVVAGSELRAPRAPAAHAFRASGRAAACSVDRADDWGSERRANPSSPAAKRPSSPSGGGRAGAWSGATWWAVTSAGVFGGLALALALTGLFAWLWPGGIAAHGKYQFVMWLLAPLWLAAMNAAFLFRNGRRAWQALGGASLAAFAGLFACRHFFA
ncbi:hypothetical protein [Rhodocyclus gracilis]|uniref:hypothetical protein n=1 Tax=Rhodocyclus gracilis TaxID=2929842 RepID=UPI001E3A6714|nr:hypothetical protein [Rhodocyclus gracilis]